MKKVSYGLALLALFLCLPSLSGHSRATADTRELMQRKLKHSQKVLEGIALGNFEEIAKNAEELIQISKQTAWRVIESPRYELFSDEFRRNADDLIKKAKAKNLDGAALAYVDLTLDCVKCHKYVREVRMTRLDGDPQAPPANGRRTVSAR